MAIAEKLTTIAENQQKVYDAGYEKGKAESGGGSYDEGYTAGQQAEYDRFWDLYQGNGTRTTYQYAFAGSGWRTDIFKPKYSIIPTSGAYMFNAFNGSRDGSQEFYENGIDLDEVFTNRGLTLDFSKCTDFSSMFFQAHIKRIGTIDMTACTNVSLIASVFNSEFLYTIRNLIPPNLEMKNTCWQVRLRDLTIGGTITKNMNLSRCDKLTDASVQSVIDHLADLTGQTTQTLTFHATVGGKLTDAQKAAITAKNWTLVY